jgi:Ca2+-binding RTX toxin-like protein
MKKHSPRKNSKEFVDSAVSVSNAVIAGADPADPAVMELLNDILETFKPTFRVGTDGRDVFSADQFNLNYINALGGDDVIFGSRNSDVLVGGDGGDVLDGEGGDDGLFGGAGDDVLSGGNGEDVLRGDEGNDVLDGGNGRDTLDGGVGEDVLNGGNGRDSMSGGDGNDSATGGNGSDWIDGGAGADSLDGGVGDDVINGGAGVDTITGGEGRDTIVVVGPRFNGGATTEDDGVRQVVNTPDVLTDWSIAEDTFQIDTSDFLITGELEFFNGLAANIPEGGINVIVLQDTDNDNNPATAFNAGAAASLIAVNLDTSGAGFFVYFNSALQIN